MTTLQSIGVRVCLLLCFGTVVSSGCEDTGPRVYTAQRYSTDGACLEPYTAIGLVQADTLASTCSAVCLRLADDLYVSTVCAPYPLDSSVEAPDEFADCAAAQAAPTCEVVEGADAAPP